MSLTAVSGKSRLPAGIGLAPPSKTGDKLFRFVTWAMALMVLLLLLLVALTLCRGSAQSLSKFGFDYFVHTNWDPVNGDYGALPAIYLTELAPGWIRQPAISMIEMLAAIPSVVFGVWGMYVLVPWLQNGPYTLLSDFLGFLPTFSGPISGRCMLSAAIVIAIMILPIITSIAREVFRAVPLSQREAAYALGATRWEVTRLAVLTFSIRGIFGAAMLGLGRALGETMAVTMVIGNTPQIAHSLLANGTTMASVIANEYAEATSDMHRAALTEIGLALFGVTIVVNAFARFLVWMVTRGAPSATH